MPTVNVYYQNQNFQPELISVASELRVLIANLLSGNDIQLKLDEVTVRLLPVFEPSPMIADVEVEITAHAFPERVKKQDVFCNQIRDKIMAKHPAFKDVRVWMILAELGHSW